MEEVYLMIIYKLKYGIREGRYWFYSFDGLIDYLKKTARKNMKYRIKDEESGGTVCTFQIQPTKKEINHDSSTEQQKKSPSEIPIQR
jgi:hypothetical protein